MENETYTNYLKGLLENNITNTDYLKLDLYLTLLSLNNNNYNEKIYLDELNTIEDFLRKTNNLKVKIQLKRKDEEINALLNNIKEIYETNKLIINKYNKESIDIVNAIESKEPKDITLIIDKLTKEKNKKVANKAYYDKLRTDILNNIFITNHYISDNKLYLGDTIVIPLDEFYQVFDYLLDINNYQTIYHSEEINLSRKGLIESIIVSINDDKPLTNYIPIILTSLFTNNNINYDDVDTSKFNIDNIKISELYSLANNDLVDNNKIAKWKKVLIPNSYLYNKIKVIVNKGMYYFQNNIFIMEAINDFKISILTEDLITFLQENITKHI